jgi:hypothetical protein
MGIGGIPSIANITATVQKTIMENPSVATAVQAGTNIKKTATNLSAASEKMTDISTQLAETKEQLAAAGLPAAEGGGIQYETIHLHSPVRDPLFVYYHGEKPVYYTCDRNNKVKLISHKAKPKTRTRSKSRKSKKASRRKRRN